MREALERGHNAETARSQRVHVYALAFPDLAAELRCSLHGELPSGWDADIPIFPADAKGMATRAALGKVVNAMAAWLPALTGGSAHPVTSTKTALKGLGDFNPASTDTDDSQGSNGGGWSQAVCNLHFGAREHAMGAIVNGLAVHGGFIPYGGSFLSFCDHMTTCGRRLDRVRRRAAARRRHRGALHVDAKLGPVRRAGAELSG